MSKLHIWGAWSALLVLAACGGAGATPPETTDSVPTEAVSSTSTTAQEPTAASEAVADSEPSTMVRDLVYISGDERFRGGEQLVDVLVPSETGGPWPVVVVLHGNPRFAGKQWSMPMANALAEQGRVVFVVDWGHTTSEWESEVSLREQGDTHLAQLRCALLVTSAKAAEYGGDPDHITVVGYSAGGNAALMVAMSDIEPLETCVTSGPGVAPQAAISIEGDLLLGAPVWDREFVEDPEAFYSMTPWRLLDPDDQFPVHILAVDNTVGVERSLGGADPYDTFLATRHTDIDLIAELRYMGILDDDKFTNLEGQDWAHRTLLNAGYETSWTVLAESRHANIGDPQWALSDQAWQIAIDAILNAENSS